MAHPCPCDRHRDRDDPGACSRRRTSHHVHHAGPGARPTSAAARTRRGKPLATLPERLRAVDALKSASRAEAATSFSSAPACAAAGGGPEQRLRRRRATSTSRHCIASRAAARLERRRHRRPDLARPYRRAPREASPRTERHCAATDPHCPSRRRPLRRCSWSIASNPISSRGVKGASEGTVAARLLVDAGGT